MFSLPIFILTISPTVFSEIYFFEEFSDESYTNRWIESTHRGFDQGKFQLGIGKYFGDYWKERGLQTSQNSKYYGISALLDKPFNTTNKTLVIQYQLQLEEPIQCGGGYIKILGADFDQRSFHEHTPYKIMFGPDICGSDKKLVHVILNYRDKYYMINKNIKCKEDRYTHLYTLIITSNNTYSVLIDNTQVEAGRLEEDWDILPSKKIKDPKAVKPADWVEIENIEDISDTKPLDWDQPRFIPDSKAKKPPKWDDENDGIWEPPKIENPEYRGEWRRRKIPNPDYKGPWIHPKIDNPEYHDEPNLYEQTSIGGVGFDIWQVVSGSIFDNILLTDDPKLAYKYGENLWRTAYEDQKKAFVFEKDHELKQKQLFQKLAEERERAEKEPTPDEIFDENENSKKLEL